MRISVKYRVIYRHRDKYTISEKCPYDAAKDFIAKKLPYILGLRKIPADRILMRPSLLDK